MQRILINISWDFSEQTLTQQSRHWLANRIVNLTHINFANVLYLNIRLLFSTVQLRSNIPHLPKSFSRNIHITNLRIDGVGNLLKKTVANSLYLRQLQINKKLLDVGLCVVVFINHLNILYNLILRSLKAPDSSLCKPLKKGFENL